MDTKLVAAYAFKSDTDLIGALNLGLQHQTYKMVWSAIRETYRIANEI